MPFTSKTWQNGPGGGTPLNATGLNDLEARIAAQSVVQVVAKGNLGATPTLAMPTDGEEIWMTGVLTANATLTITGLQSGQSGRLLLKQDATGSRTLSVTVGASTVGVLVNSAPGSATTVTFTYDGTDLYVEGV